MMQGTFANSDEALWPGEFVRISLIVSIDGCPCAAAAGLKRLSQRDIEDAAGHFRAPAAVSRRLGISSAACIAKSIAVDNRLRPNASKRQEPRDLPSIRGPLAVEERYWGRTPPPPLSR